MTQNANEPPDFNRILEHIVQRLAHVENDVQELECRVQLMSELNYPQSNYDD